MPPEVNVRFVYFILIDINYFPEKIEKFKNARFFRRTRKRIGEPIGFVFGDDHSAVESRSRATGRSGGSIAIAEHFGTRLIGRSRVQGRGNDLQLRALAPSSDVHEQETGLLPQSTIQDHLLRNESEVHQQ